MRRSSTRWGLSRRPDDAVVDVEQRHEHLDALHRRRREAGAHRLRPRRRRPAPSSTATRRTSSSAQAGKSGAARFLFATEGGHDPRLVADRERRRSRSPASTTRRRAPSTRAWRRCDDRLYATDFHNGRVDVFDASFKPVTLRPFTDPKLPEGLRAVRHPGARRATSSSRTRSRTPRRRTTSRAAGNGYVDEFTPDGAARRARRVGRPEERPAERAVGPRARAGELRRVLAATCSSATSATAGSARTRISAAASGSTRASSATATRRSITIDGLWAIAFGNGAAGGPTTTLYFAAGPSDESHGLFGSITAG